MRPLDEALVKQIFFYSDRPRRDALIADGVDIMQFAQNVVEITKRQIAIEEHARCVKIVTGMNKDVGHALSNTPPGQGAL